MKVRGILWAKRNGFDGVYTGNDRTNKGMIAINTRLGFVEKPGWVEFRREFTPAD